MLADRLTETLREPVELGDGRQDRSPSPPASAWRSASYSTPDELLRDADLALYAAKAAGKDRYALFDASMYADAEGRLALEADLSTAVEEDQFFLLYQPIFDLASQRGGRRRGARPLAPSTARRGAARTASSRSPRRAG